ncbi:MAG: hypothetical protein KJS45_03800, partial [Bacteroidetes bacterium]|nr:hypothetical protein [Bacteroidota bacterium]
MASIKFINPIPIFILLLVCVLYTDTAFSQCITTITPSNPIISCGQNITLTATNTNATGFTWSPASSLSSTTGASVTASPTVTTTYTVTPTGCSPATPVTVVVTVNPPTASFTFTPNTPCASTPINFTNTSTGIGLTYSWNFGNTASGVQNTSTQANPSHTFIAPNGGSNSSFTVLLTVTSTNGCTASSSQTVTVRQLPQASIQDFSDNSPFVNCGSSGQFNLPIDNNSTTVSTNTNYQINWGDGTPNYSSPTLPTTGTTHLYTSLGFFNLVLTVTGQNGCTASNTYSVFNGSNPGVG